VRRAKSRSLVSTLEVLGNGLAPSTFQTEYYSFFIFAEQVMTARVEAEEILHYVEPDHQANKQV